MRNATRLRDWYDVIRRLGARCGLADTRAAIGEFKTNLWQSEAGAELFMKGSDAGNMGPAAVMDAVLNQYFLEYCPPGTRVLDLGCGHGIVSRFLARNGCVVTACDVSEVLLKVLAETSEGPNIQIRMGDAHAIPAGDAEFDVIVARMFLGHFPDWPDILCEMTRCCRPGGKLVIHFSSKENNDFGLRYGRLDCQFATSPDPSAVGTFWTEADGKDLDKVCRQLGLTLQKRSPCSFFLHNRLIGHSLGTGRYAAYQTEAEEFFKDPKVQEFVVWFEKTAVQFLPAWAAYYNILVLAKEPPARGGTAGCAEHLSARSVTTVPLRILLATPLGAGVHEYGNMGDVALVQVAVARLKNLWPSAILEVPTDSATSLATYCPGATAVPKAGLRIWLSNGVGLGRYSRRLPSWSVNLLVGVKRVVRAHWPGLLKLVIGLKKGSRYHPVDVAAVAEFVETMKRADLVVVCGSGGFYDGSREWNDEVLNLVEEATRRRVPVVLLGQGFGPLTDPEVLSTARRLLPSVGLITLRGSPGGAELLAALGVPPSKVQTTGDEAVELAFGARPQTMGHALGVNVRIGRSADTGAADIDKLRPFLEEFATRHAVEVIPVPIALDSYHADHRSIAKLLAALDSCGDGGATLDSPLKVIGQVGRCRVVVTGAYHAAVFALSQGVSVVALARSTYFVSKFQGLRDQFGAGCETVLLDRPDAGDALMAAVEKAWHSADDVRGALLEAACRQATASRNAYDRVKDLVAEFERRS